MYLNCKTYYSLRYGTYSTEELVLEAADKLVTTLALTNINSTIDSWEFVKLCQQNGIKPVLGTEIRNKGTLLYILIAANNNGLRWIHRFLSEHLMNKKPFPLAGDTPLFFDNQNDGFVIYPLRGKPLEQLERNEYVGILPTELNMLYSIDWKPYKDRFVIRQPVTFQNQKKYFNLHRLLRAIDENAILTKLTIESQASPDEIFLAPSELLEKFKDYPGFVTNTYKLMDACDIKMEFYTDKTKKVFGGTPEDDRKLLEKLALDGFSRRYGMQNKVALERLHKELKIINDLGFNAYFLINWDMVMFAKNRGSYYVGRGSGANSIVAYCLYITEVCPVELNLFFERFLNPHRKSPPDFDIDFSWRDRDEIMDYLFKRHGSDYVALLGSISTFKYDAATHELGKVFGLSEEEIKAVQKSPDFNDPIHKLVIQYSRLLHGFPNIMSLHPCGVLISDKAISHYATRFMPPKGFPTVQMDMFTAEDVGLNKFDVLSQRGLGHIKDCLAWILLNKGVRVDIFDIQRFKKDEQIKKQIREANTIGCFYIESPAMRGLLKKLRCDDYLTLVAASSIIRPGVAESGMMREYIERYHNTAAIKYLHPLFEEHLGETFGVMVYQEDVIKIGYYFAGLDLGEADILRRAMSGKYRSDNEFQMIKEKFMSNCEKLGHSTELAQEVWRQMQSFAGYSFNKAHSASFAVESYQSLFLKTYYPKEFMVSVINNFGGFYTTELYFLELLKCGGEIHPPCINNSEYYTSIDDNTIYLGLIHIKSLQKKLAEAILDNRDNHGSFLHLQEFIERINPGLEQLNILIQIGAFGFTGKSKKRLLWEANFLQKRITTTHHHALFEEKPVEFELPQLIDLRIDDLYDQMEILGFPLTNPFELADEDPASFIDARDLEHYKGQKVTVLAYFITRKHVTTKRKDQMFFGTFVDHNLDWIDTVHFPDSAKKFPLHSSGFYKISGKVVEDFGVFSIEVSYMEQTGYKQRSYANL
ncbi:DNA polymerase III subunit alpha [Niabella beijingensis]|uniref:DNA polymerase III subunit alpha n=1 Tax=Niabella beijingensis TaxID=2872700 RepID=UPI001CBB900C|nr:DNA polymerase III subunit alpha [Niabella beijingensis]MBZ4187653.1 DNA polymerase III subunit alpha [Niabella beijingensis]